MKRLILVITAGCLFSGGLHAQDAADLAARAKAVLQTHCHRCHGDKGAVEGGLNYMLGRHHLVLRKKIAPGDPASSLLWQRVQKGEMPPEEAKERPSPAEVALLERWITAGAPDWETTPRKREFISFDAVQEMIWNDLSAQPELDRPFLRYFTLTHFYNAGFCEDELDTYRQAVSKLINSLSWGPRIAVPPAIDPARTVFRIDLRKYDWSRQMWTKVMTFSSNRRFSGSDVEKRCQEATQDKVFQVRPDWLASRTATTLYGILLQMPKNLDDLEKKLRVDVERNSQSGQVIRAGFDNSLVSPAARVIERHESLFGAYWLTHELATTENLFKQPLLPSKTRFSGRSHEVLFHLPNGLVAFADTDAKSSFKDPRHRGHFIRPGLSCISCHTDGLVVRDDMVRARVEENPKAYKKDVEKLLQLHVPKDKLRALMDEDIERFREAVKQTGCRPGGADPIVALAVRYEADLDLNQAAAEVWMPTAELLEKLPNAKEFKPLAPLTKEGATISRKAFSGGGSTLTPVYGELLLPVRGNFIRAPALPLANLIPQLRSIVPFRPTRRDDHLLYEWEPKGFLEAMAFSAQRGLVAAESRPGVVTIFDPVAGQQRTTLRQLGDRVLAIDFSPDGKLLATGNQDKTARLWDVDSGELLKTLFPHPEPVSGVKFSPDGKTLVTVSPQVGLWNLETGQAMPSPFLKVPGGIGAVVFSPDGKTLAVIGKGVRLWQADTGKEIVVLRGHKGPAHAVAFSADGKLLATGGADKKVILWDLADYEIRATFKGHGEAVRSLAFAPDGKVLVSGAGAVPAGAGNLGEVKVWDVVKGSLKDDLLSHTKGVTGVVIGGDGKLAAAAAWDRSLRVWSLDKSQPAIKTEIRPFEGHSGDILALALSPDGKRALTGGTDGTLRLWDSATGKELLRLPGHELGVQAVGFADGSTACSSGLDKTLRQWDLAKGAAGPRFDLPPTTFLTALSPDGKILALTLKEGGVQMVDTANGKKVRDLEDGPKFVQSLAFSADGRLLAAASSAGGSITRVWDVASGKGKTLEKEFGHQFPVAALAFSRDGRFLASGSSDRTVCIWDLQAGREVRRIGYFPIYVQGLVFAPDGKTVFVSSGSAGRGPTDPTNGSIAQVDVSTGKLLQYWDELPGVPLRGMFLSDGRHLLTVLGGTLKRWIPEGGRMVTQK